MENKTKKTLLERYAIPIHHLDFKYIEKCKDGREMEKILHVLSSNEEGYFPDLTKCAEEKLKELKPQSRLFRVEEKIKGREALEPNELKPIYDWNLDIKVIDKKLQKLVKESKAQDLNVPNNQIPPIRKCGRILKNQNNNEKSTNSNNSKTEKSSNQRIKSTDYNKWDKYDPEEELLRIDLAEEREQEEVESKNRLNMSKLKKEPLTITEIKEEDAENLDKWLNLSEIERENLSENYRLCGNEYFRSKEYDSALNEYSKAIQCYPEKAVAAFNNRALTYFKQQQFLDCMQDCEECLKLEPSNIKANLRLAEANYAYGKRRESYQLYINVLKLDAENSTALKAITELRKQFEDLPPPNATRVQIQEESTRKENKKTPEVEIVKPSPKSKVLKSKTINYDLADLVQPNRVVPNKVIKAAETFGKNMTNVQNKTQHAEKCNNLPANTDSEFHLSVKNQAKKGKILIQEI